MHDEKEQFLHQFAGGRVWIVQALAFGVRLTYFFNNLQDLHAGVVSHSEHILLAAHGLRRSSHLATSASLLRFGA